MLLKARVFFALAAVLAAARAGNVEVNWGISSGDVGKLVIGIGDTVTWKWADDLPHTVTHDDGTPLFDSGSITGAGQVFSVTFDAPTFQDQEYAFVCGIHASMKGIVVVEPNGPGDNEADCGPLPPPSGIPLDVNFAQPCSATVETTVCSPTCPPNYQRLGGTPSRTCNPDGVWSGDSGSCELIGCGEPPVPENFPSSGDTSLYKCSLNTVGAKCSVACPLEYMLEGPTERECLASGQWSGGDAKCIILPSVEVDEGFIVIKTDQQHDIKLVRGSQVWTVSNSMQHQSKTDSAIDDLKDRASATEGDVTNLQTAQTTMGGTLSDLSDSIDDVNTDVSGVSSRVDDVDQLIRQVQSALDTEVDRATTADQGFADDVVRLEELLSDLSSGHLDLKDLQQVHLDAATSLTNALDVEVTRAKGAEGDLSDRIDGVSAVANAAKTTAESADSKAVAAKTKADQVASDLSDALTTIDGLKTQLDDLKKAIESPRRDGQWLLIMKIKADTTFGYSHSAWSSANTVGATDESLTPANVKYSEFNTKSFKSIRLCVGTTTNCYVYTFSSAVANALSLFNGPARREGIDQSKWMSLFGNPSARNCGMQEPGFNFPHSDGNRQRWGFKNNIPSQGCQTSDGDDADGSIGVGITGQDCCPCGAGYTNYFVRNDPASNTGNSAGKCFNAWIWIADF